MKTKRKVKRHARINRGQKKVVIEVKSHDRRYQKNEEMKEIKEIEVYVIMNHIVTVGENLIMILVQNFWNKEFY
jgi:hypothetical protein